MLGLSYVGQAPVSGIGYFPASKKLRENLGVAEKLRPKIFLSFLETFNIDDVVSALETQVLKLVEKFGLREVARVVSVKIILKNLISAKEKFTNTQLLFLKELLAIRDRGVSFLWKVLIKEKFSLTNKFDLLIDNIKRLWERCFRKRGEY